MLALAVVALPYAFAMLAVAAPVASDAVVDLLFTDVVMPDGMTGYQLAAAARAFLPDLRILFTTGYVRPEPADAPAHPAGATLRKPYRRQELAAIVRAALYA